MGIFSNPSEVPIPGPPPKKETVIIELAGCGNWVKSFNIVILLTISKLLFLVWRSCWVCCVALSKM